MPYINSNVEISKIPTDYYQNGDVIIADASEDYEGIVKA